MIKLIKSIEELENCKKFIEIYSVLNGHTILNLSKVYGYVLSKNYDVLYIKNKNIIAENLNVDRVIFSVKYEECDHLCVLMPKYMEKHTEYIIDNCESHVWNPKCGMDQEPTYLKIDFSLRKPE